MSASLVGDPAAAGESEQASPLVSVIIPVYNEAEALPAVLDNALKQSGNYEIILVDGGSSDRSMEIARGYPGVRVLASSKGRARQMNAGAAVARGEWLLFLHADTLLPEGAIACVARLAADAGAFRHRFSGDDWRLRFISWGHNTRCSITRIFYGDQVIFVRGDLFRRLCGFPEVAVLEDVIFCERLVRATRPVLLDRHVVTDARKFVKMGIARTVLRGLSVLLRHQLRLPLKEAAFFGDVR